MRERDRRPHRPHVLRTALGLLLCLLAGCQAEPTGEAPRSDAGAKTDQTSTRADAQDSVGKAVANLLASAAKRDPAELDPLVDALAALGPAAIPHLVDAGLRDPNEDVRGAVVEALGKIGGEDAGPALLAALKDENSDIRQKAVEQLGELRVKSAAKPLLDQYQRDKDPQVRYECLTSLGLIGDPVAADLLLKETRSEDPYVRMWAADGLCEMGDQHASAVALALLHDPDRYVREQVLRSCVRALDTPEGHQALIAMALSDDFQISVWVRRDLHSYVESGGGKTEVADTIRAAALRALQGDQAVRGALLLGDLADPVATDRLIEALHDPDQWVRHHAAFLLGRIGEGRAVPPLIEALGDPVPLVSATARQALQEFAKRGDTRAAEAIKNSPAAETHAQAPGAQGR